jgi:hypothetical protein
MVVDVRLKMVVETLQQSLQAMTGYFDLMCGNQNIRGLLQSKTLNHMKEQDGDRARRILWKQHWIEMYGTK